MKRLSSALYAVNLAGMVAAGLALPALLPSGTLPADANAWAQNRYITRITEVRYVGLASFTPHDLENYLPFSVGDNWHAVYAEQTRQVVKDYYEKRGFYSAKVRVSVQDPPAGSRDVGLVVHIDEGAPCLIRSLSLNDPPGFKSQHSRTQFKQRMFGILLVRPGDRYDEQVLADRLRELKEWLADKDFILANTDRIKVSYNDARTEAHVVIDAEYGDRVTVGFRGNTVFTKGELNELIAQLRATGLGKDYVGVIERRFAEEYRARAYNGVRIAVKTRESELGRHLTFTFDEGIRSELREVQWEGLSDEEVVMARKAFYQGSSRLVQRGYYVDKDVDKAILLVLEDLKSRGYLVSKLIAKSVQPLKSPRGTHRVRVVIQIAQGEQTLVGKVALEGFGYFGRERLLSVLGLADGKPFNPFLLEEGLQRLRALYVADGYLDFHVLTNEEQIVGFTENNRRANVTLRVAEGVRVKVGSIAIQGLKKTREFVVKRELAVKPGDWWLAEWVEETETNLRRLGVFAEVRIIAEPSPMGSGYRDMLIDLKEGEPGVLEFGPGIRSDLGVKGFGNLSYNNILGRNWIGTLSAQTNRRLGRDYRFWEYNIDASFVEPRFLGTRNLYMLELTTKLQRFPPDSSEERTEFNAQTTEFVTGFERKIGKRIKTKLTYKLEQIRQFDVYTKGLLSVDDNRSMLIGSLNPALTIDTRDNPFTTTNGWLFTGSLEYAHPRLSSQAVEDTLAPGYQKWDISLRRYTLLGKNIVWSNVASYGFARSNIANREIPLIKLFRLGGYGTIRGYEEDAINVDTQKILGTLSYINLRTQIDLPVVGELYFAPFLDAGNLYIDQLQGSPFFRAGTGFGLHYLTPVGPINFDLGYLLRREADKPGYQIHFSVGLI